MKKTKHALLLSAVSMLLCLSMLVGSTFAWFTDTASTGVNKIVAGNLDIDIVDATTGESLAGQSLSFVKEDGSAITGTILWEPGCRYLLQPAKVVNEGNLWVKYTVVISGYTAPAGGVDLAEVIDVYEGENKIGTLKEVMTNGTLVAESTLAPKGENGSSAAFGALKLVMQETAGNDYQGKAISGVTISVFASQYTEEFDSFDNQYDKDALGVQEQNVLDLVADGYTKVTTADELKNAMTDGSKVVLANNIDLGNITASGLTVAKGATVVLDLNGYAITAVDTAASGNIEVIMNKGTLTIKDSAATGKITVSATTDRSWNALSAVVSNIGTLNVEGGVLQHLGGTSMSYAIDARSTTLNNVTTNITGGRVVSAYIGIRLMNTVGFTDDLTVTGGVVSGANTSVWVQYNAPASVIVSGEGFLDGRFLNNAATYSGNNFSVPSANINGTGATE